MKILVLTDSLGLPRDLPEQVLYEKTWVSLLAKGHTVLQSSIGGGTSYDLYRQMAYLKAYRPDIVLLQVGIVDCAPRALTYNENIFLNNFKITRKFTNILLPKIGHFLRKVRNISYISIKEFKKNLEGIVNFYPQAKFIFIGIMPATDEYEVKLKRMKKQITIYNREAKMQFGEWYMDNSEVDSSLLMSDHHHLNKNGHLYLSKKIELLLKTIC